MLSDVIECGFETEHFFSCYFPKEDSSECNEYGSCLLKEKAYKRQSKKIKG